MEITVQQEVLKKLYKCDYNYEYLSYLRFS